MAVEAFPALAEAMERFVQKHDLRNVTVINKALGAVDGTTSFTLAPRVDALSGIKRRPDLVNETVEVIEIAMTRLDTVIATQKLDKLRFIKLDLEGGEYDALRGSPGVLRGTSAPLLILENGRQWSGDLYGFGKEEWFRLFADTGYQLFDLFGYPFAPDVWDEPDLCWYSIAAKRPEDVAFVTNQLTPLIDHINGTMPVAGDLRWPTQKFAHAYVV